MVGGSDIRTPAARQDPNCRPTIAPHVRSSAHAPAPSRAAWLARAADQRSHVPRHVAARRPPAPPRRVHRDEARGAPASGPAAGVRRAGREAARPRPRADASRPLAGIGRRAGRDDMVRRPASAVRLQGRVRSVRRRGSGARTRRVRESHRGRPGPLAVGNRRDGAPRQQRRGRGRQRQRFRNGRPDRAGALVRESGGPLDRTVELAAREACAHARLPLDGRRGARRDRRGALRRALGDGAERRGRDRPRRDRRQRAPTPRVRRRPAADDGRRAPRHRRGPDPRSAGSPARAADRAPPAARPRVPVQLLRAGAAARREGSRP